VRDLSCGGRRVFLEMEIRRVNCRKCGTVKQEEIPWFSKRNPFYTERFAWHVGRRCRKETIKDVADEFHLDWRTVKELEKEYMAEQLRYAGKPYQVLPPFLISIRHFPRRKDIPCLMVPRNLRPLTGRP